MSAILRIIEVVSAFLMAAYLIGRVVWPLVRRSKWLLLVLCFIGVHTAHAQLWSGYVDSERGIDWQSMPYTPPDTSGWTQCGTTMASTSTVAEINTRIASCSANQYVLLGAGTFTVNSLIVIQNKSNIELRGSGPLETFLVGTGGGCTDGSSLVCADGAGGAFFNGNSSRTAISSGFTPGSTSVVVTSASGLSVGQPVYLNQDNEDLFASYAPFVSCAAPYIVGGGSCQGTVNSGRGMGQWVEITNITGTTITFTPAIYYTRASQSLSPSMEFFSTVHAENVGITNMTVETTAADGGAYGSVQFNGVNGGWMRNVRIDGCNNTCVKVHHSRKISIFENYFYRQNSFTISTHYGVLLCCSSDIAVYNNICQQIQACFMGNGGVAGSIIAYNFSRNNPFDNGDNNNLTDNNAAIYPNHAAGMLYQLIEGNDVNTVSFDVAHGSGGLHTLVRNVLNGRTTNISTLTTVRTIPVVSQAYQRFNSYFGNVLGTDGYHTTYDGHPGAAAGSGFNTSIYTLGFSGPNEDTPEDAEVYNSTYRWGNYDTVNDAVRWESSEVPSDQSTPGSNTVPSSFYLSAKPSWFGSVTWPPIGPEVTGGSVSGYGGRVHKIPARLCYESLGGAADGQGSMLDFDADECYTADTAAASGTIIIFLEYAAAAVSVGWHFRNVLVAGVMAAVVGISTIATLALPYVQRTYTTSKTVTAQVVLALLQQRSR